MFGHFPRVGNFNIPSRLTLLCFLERFSYVQGKEQLVKSSEQTEKALEKIAKDKVAQSIKDKRNEAEIKAKLVSYHRRAKKQMEIARRKGVEQLGKTKTEAQRKLVVRKIMVKKNFWVRKMREMYSKKKAEQKNKRVYRSVSRER